MSSRELLLQDVEDARAKENVLWIYVLAGLVIIIVGVTLASHAETNWIGLSSRPYLQTGAVLAILGVVTAIAAGYVAAVYREKKTKFMAQLKELIPLCPSCGKEVSFELKLCPYCGEKLVHPKKKK